jgi:hypothetical protein
LKAVPTTASTARPRQTSRRPSPATRARDLRYPARLTIWVTAVERNAPPGPCPCGSSPSRGVSAFMSFSLWKHVEGSGGPAPLKRPF